MVQKHKIIYLIATSLLYFFCTHILCFIHIYQQTQFFCFLFQFIKHFVQSLFWFLLIFYYATYGNSKTCRTEPANRTAAKQQKQSVTQFYLFKYSSHKKPYLWLRQRITIPGLEWRRLKAVNSPMTDQGWYSTYQHGSYVLWTSVPWNTS